MSQPHIPSLGGSHHPFRHCEEGTPTKQSSPENKYLILDCFVGSSLPRNDENRGLPRNDERGA